MLYILIFLILITASITDIKKMVVPYRYQIALFLLYPIFFNISNLSGTVIAVPFLFANRNGRQMGGGDIKIAVLLGGLIGLKSMMVTTIIGCMAFILYGVCFKRNKGEYFPFIPFITFGYIVTIILEVAI
jgi:prepilin signal peptidase PulO-like enzyme (type II secretory pathway)